ncbi:MAG: isoprenylcysteine carboxylmethyltransferase family protein [Caldilineaceae bacterium]|nr:isoprenylcysteine carboxylmethyltransferase family protein [Caldilineaceae bacterium]
MTINVPHEDTRLTPALRAGIRKRFSQVGAIFLLQAAMLFLAAGRLDWVWAWVFIGLNLTGATANAVLLLRHSPETVAERASAQGMKGWDKWVGGAWAVTYFVMLLVVAGLDQRFGWTGLLPIAYHSAGVMVFGLGFALFSWAMITNAYFAAIVRIQTERGHTVCTSGPYRFVRHPGYVGAILQTLSAPLLLGSLWALLPGGLAVLLMVVRTALEDRTLHEELAGYATYAQRVRYRLLPGLW